MKLYDGTFGCCWLIIALLGLAFLTACSSSHLQVFTTTTESQYNAWVPTMQAGSESLTVDRLCKWMHDNMEYEPGLYAFWPSKLSAWNQRTNCAGFTVVAADCLRTLEYSDFQFLQVDTKFATVTGKWHVILFNKRYIISNSSWATNTTSTPEELCAMFYADWSKYYIYDINRQLVKVVERP